MNSEDRIHQPIGRSCECRPKLLISGYYGFRNFGDEVALDLLLDVTAPYVRKTTVLARPSTETEDRHALRPNLRFVDKRSLRKRVQAIRNSDLVLIGPGGLLKRPPGGTAASLVAVGLTDAAIAAALGVPFVLYSIGSGDLTAVDQKLLKAVVRHAILITSRDRRTHSLMSSIGVSSSVRVDDSIREHLARQPVDHTLSQTNRDEIAVAPSVSDREFHTDRQRYVTKLAAKVRDASQGRPTVGVVTQGGSYGDGQVLELLRHEGIEFDSLVDLSLMSHEEATAAIGHFSAVVSSRFHVCVVAEYLGIPWEPVGADPKLLDLGRPVDDVQRGYEVIQGLLTSRLEPEESRPYLWALLTVATVVHRLDIARRKVLSSAMGKR